MPFYNSNDGFYYEDSNYTTRVPDPKLGSVPVDGIPNILVLFAGAVVISCILSALAMPILAIILLAVFRRIDEFNPEKILISSFLLSFIASVFHSFQSTMPLASYIQSLSNMLILIGIYCICYSFSADRNAFSNKGRTMRVLLDIFLLALPVINAFCLQIPEWILECASHQSLLPLDIDMNALIYKALPQARYLALYIAFLILQGIISEKGNTLSVIVFSLLLILLSSISISYLNNHLRFGFFFSMNPKSIILKLTMLILAFAANSFSNGKIQRGCILSVLYYVIVAVLPGYMYIGL